ncbi:hypothetical protein O3M35_009705 [Rhynocoris fuscipes]|uniref:Uncharacterized protein n=1 Tax=Rhynocoris fuscipes TaxID=488301 RepID=A0AAW1D685_9HEMI
MAMNACRVHVFLSGLSFFKMAEIMVKMIHVRVALPRQKRMKISKKLVILCVLAVG